MKKGMYWLGKHLNEEHKQKLSKSLKGINTWKKGCVISEETRKKISVGMMGINTWRKGCISPNKGKKMSDEQKQKISLSLIGKIGGSKNPNWKGGLSFIPYSKDWTFQLKEDIKNRDNHICFVCKNKGNTVHHIDYDKLNCSPKNLITLCHMCHCKTNGNRKYWINFFSK